MNAPNFVLNILTKNINAYLLVLKSMSYSAFITHGLYEVNNTYLCQAKTGINPYLMHVLRLYTSVEDGALY